MWSRRRRQVARVSTASPALRRVRRLKLVTALLLMVALTIGLLLFGLVIVSADADLERDRVDGLLERQIAAAVDRVDYDGTGGVVVGFADDPKLAGGYPQLYVAEVSGRTRPQGRVVFSPLVPFWPDADVVTIAEQTVGAGTSSTEATVDARRVPPVDGMEDLRLAAHVVPGTGVEDDEVRAVVVGAATLASGQDSHDRLVSLLWWSAGAILLLGCCVAVPMARGRFWLVDRALARHEMFLHDTAHELRSPVATLRAITEAGLAGDEPPRQALERSLRVIRNTDEVIEDLMTLTRVETGREGIDAEPVRLDLLVEALVAQRPDAATIRLRGEPSVVAANPVLLRRAVGNLVDNAVLHGRAGDPAAEIVVEVGHGRVTVTDDGPGVAPQLLPHLLERRQGGGRRTGSGLGLALAAWVARMHGGRLEASNGAGGGAVFTLELAEVDDPGSEPGSPRPRARRSRAHSGK